MRATGGGRGFLAVRIIMYFLLLGGLIGGILVAVRAVTRLPSHGGDGEVQARDDSVPNRIEAAEGIDVVLWTTHLGQGRPGDILQGSFALVNRTPTQVRYRLHVGCSCGKVDPQVGEIPPRGRVEIRVSLSLRKYGQDEAANVSLMLAGSDRFPVIRFTGSCPSPLVVDPPVLDFGQVMKGRPARRICTLRPRDSSGGSLVCQATSQDPRVVVKLESHGQTQTLAASLDPEADVGVLSGGVVLTLSDNTQLMIPIRGEIVRLIEWAPVLLRLGPDEREPKSVLIWRSDGGTLKGIRVLSQPTGVATELVRLSQHKYRVLVSRTGLHSETKSARLVLDIDASSSRQRVEIPLILERHGGKP